MATPAVPSHEEIARLAYSYWQARGRQHGSSQDDWFRAERELRRGAQKDNWPPMNADIHR